MDGFLSFLREFRPHTFIFGGDNLDPWAISHWNEPNWIRFGLENILNEFRELISRFTEYLDQILTILPHQCEVIYLIGNHEDWIEQFKAKFPQIKGDGLPELLGPIASRIKFLPRYSFYRIGNLTFCHGEHFETQNPAKLYVEKCKTTVVFGHHHYAQMWPDFSMVDDENKYFGFSTPCWTSKKAHYGKHQPNRWQNGFFTACIKEKSGNFSPHPMLASPQGHFIDLYGQEFCN